MDFVPEPGPPGSGPLRPGDEPGPVRAGRDGLGDESRDEAVRNRGRSGPSRHPSRRADGPHERPGRTDRTARAAGPDDGRTRVGARRTGQRGPAAARPRRYPAASRRARPVMGTTRRAWGADLAASRALAALGYEGREQSERQVAAAAHAPRAADRAASDSTGRSLMRLVRRGPATTPRAMIHRTLTGPQKKPVNSRNDLEGLDRPLDLSRPVPRSKPRSARSQSRCP